LVGFLTQQFSFSLPLALRAGLVLADEMLEIDQHMFFEIFRISSTTEQQAFAFAHSNRHDTGG